tara:strand:- start:3125 stop:3376 length:252 start_codon:yes stop_codon:yes gene_type:complete
VSAVSTVTAMHEKVHAAANQQEQERPCPQKVNPVLEKQKYAGSGEKYAECHSRWCSQERRPPAFVCLWLSGWMIMMSHDVGTS